ncbi:MAG: anthranilate synthase component II [Alphaproteobacteria bacterium]
MLLMIDNYDSFTYNLVQYFGDLGQNCKVLRNDEKTADELIDLKPDGIIISPGPSDPDHSHVSLEIVNKAAKHNIPLLGVCLGHQCIGQAFGGTITRAPEPIHGKVSEIIHSNTIIFNDIPSPYAVTRYHSLIIERSSLPECLTITAETKDGIIMGVSHKEKNIHGIQFHPESIATEHGHKLLENFVRLL